MRVTVVDVAQQAGVTEHQVRAALRDGILLRHGYFGREPVIDDIALIAWIRSRSRGRRWGQQAKSAALDLLSTGHTASMSGSELSRLKRVLRSISPTHLAYLAGGLGGVWSRYRGIEFSPGLAFIGPSVAGAGLGVIGRSRMTFVQVDSLPDFEAVNVVESDPDGDIGVVERARDRRHARVLLDTYLLGDSRESAAASDALAELCRRL